MTPDPELTLYRVVLVHDTFDHVKISVTFPERNNLSSEQQWGKALTFLGLPHTEYKLESAMPLGTVRG